MRKISFLAATVFVTISLSAFSQTDPLRKDGPPKKVSSSLSSQEKASKIKELEAKIAINQTDPTFPPAELEKQKKELAGLRKSKTSSGK